MFFQEISYVVGQTISNSPFSLTINGCIDGHLLAAEKDASGLEGVLPIPDIYSQKQTLHQLGNSIVVAVVIQLLDVPTEQLFLLGQGLLQHASKLLRQFDARHTCNTLEDPSFSRGLSDWSLCPMGPHPTVKSTALLGRVDAWHSGGGWKMVKGEQRSSLKSR